MIEQIYIATTDTGLVDVFRIDSTGQWITDLEISPEQDWLVLENDMCSDCKYAGTDVKYCKAAIGLYAAVNAFSDIRSIDKLSMTRISSDNSLVTRCIQVQTGLSMLFFSCLVFSGCFKFKQFRWAWNFYRMQSDDFGLFYCLFSSYLTKQFILKANKSSELLSSEIIEEFRGVYMALKKIAKRVRKASHKDANMNALVRLISLTHLLQTKYDDFIHELEDMATTP